MRYQKKVRLSNTVFRVTRVKMSKMAALNIREVFREFSLVCSRYKPPFTQKSTKKKDARLLNILPFDSLRSNSRGAMENSFAWKKSKISRVDSYGGLSIGFNHAPVAPLVANYKFNSQQKSRFDMRRSCPQLLHKERMPLQSFNYLILCLSCACAAMYFFYHKSISWAVSRSH